MGFQLRNLAFIPFGYAHGAFETKTSTTSPNLYRWISGCGGDGEERDSPRSGLARYVFPRDMTSVSNGFFFVHYYSFSSSFFSPRSHNVYTYYTHRKRERERKSLVRLVTCPPRRPELQMDTTAARGCIDATDPL